MVPESGLQLAREVLRQSHLVADRTPSSASSVSPTALHLLIGIAIAFVVVAGLAWLVFATTQ
jgi:hypothetical protein